MINAFLSCSFKEPDRPIVDHIEAILNAEGIKTMSALPCKEPSIESPPEKIRMDILRCDCLVAIVTKPSSWIQNEIGMAYMARKPIFVFSEEDVDSLGGLSPFVTDVHKFKRDSLDLLRPVVQKLNERIAQFLFFGHKLEWYGEAVHDIIARMEQADRIEIMGRSTETFFDALNLGLKELLHNRRRERKGKLLFSVFFVPADDDDHEIRPSAKRVLLKWRKRYPEVRFYVLPREEVQLRAIVFDRDTDRVEGFIGDYAKDDEGIFLGVTQRMERFGRTSALSSIVTDRVARSRLYHEESRTSACTRTAHPRRVG